MSSNQAIADLYDRLLGREGAKVAAADFAVHKRLHLPAAWRQAGIHDSNDWLAANLTLEPAAHILDAGCGVGGSLFALLGERRTGVGLTLSGRQADLAQAEIARRGLADRCEVRQASYDTSTGERFDLIVCVEALVHSQDLGATLATLAGQLKPAGQLVLLEDMATRDLAQQPLAQILRASWRLPRLLQVKDFQEALTAAGLEVVEQADFTPFVPTKAWPGWLIRAAWGLVPAQAAAAIYVGGWAQEKLYRQGHLRYQLLRVAIS